MRNCIKTLLLSTIVLVIGNNNCYSKNNNYNEFYEYFDTNKAELKRGSDEITKKITKMISDIENTANEAFIGQQITSRSYTKFLCYLKLIDKCNNYFNGKYTMLYMIKKACNEFLQHNNKLNIFAHYGINTNNEKLQELYDLTNELKKYVQTNMDNIENVFREKNMNAKASEHAENEIEKYVKEAMEVWEKCHNKKK